jgi:hypothetical protein
MGLAQEHKEDAESRTTKSRFFRALFSYSISKG